MSTMYPSSGWQSLGSLIHILGASILAHCISRRVAFENFSSLRDIKDIPWPRICIILIFVDSWLFLISTDVLIFGIGLEHSLSTCSTAIIFCVGFYSTSKLLIYSFLAERVHIVWSSLTGTKRFKSYIYIICMVTMALYAIVISLMVFGRIDYLRKDDGTCIIGLKPVSSFFLLSYDLYVNIFLTTLFVWPLFRNNFLNPRLKRVALRTLAASGVALTTSTINILTLALFHGHEIGWVCLGSCGVDVILNALALFWVTGGLVPNSSDALRGPPDQHSHATAGGHKGPVINDHSPLPKSPFPQDLSQQLQSDSMFCYAPDAGLTRLPYLYPLNESNPVRVDHPSYVSSSPLFKSVARNSGHESNNFHMPVSGGYNIGLNAEPYDVIPDKDLIWMKRRRSEV